MLLYNMISKYISKYAALAVSAVATLGLTSCLDEVTPTSTVTDSMLETSSTRDEALLMAMPSYLTAFNSGGREEHYDFGYPAIMRIRDVQTADLTTTDGSQDGYDHFKDFSRGYMTQSLAMEQFLWQFYNKAVQTCNIALKEFSADEDTPERMGMRGQARAFRAMLYLDMARIYEFLPNDAFANADLIGLTVPIVTENTTEEEGRNNPRATHAEMLKFILDDLDYAEEHIEDSPVMERTLPTLAAVYGLKARAYMWDENYPKAAEYAAMAVDESGCYPLSASEWNDATSGFNSLANPSWIWGFQYVKEDDAISTGIVNWISFQSPENQFGYAGVMMLGPSCVAPVVNKAMYDRVSDTDFRKYTWIPDDMDSPLWNEVQLANEESAPYFAYYAPLAGVKFRCAMRELADPNVSCVVAVPLMRVEEMMLIEAEAEAHTNAAAGKALLEQFMSYRDPNYECTVSSTEDVVEEIVFQKRVELWGEGQAFFDIKRLNYPIVRNYAGSNWPANLLYNTPGRPAWMNWPILISESNNNAGVRGKNNPDVAGCYGGPETPVDADQSAE